MTMGPWRRTRAAKAASSRPSRNRARSWPSVRPPPSAGPLGSEIATLWGSVGNLACRGKCLAGLGLCRRRGRDCQIATAPESAVLAGSVLALAGPLRRQPAPDLVLGLLALDLLQGLLGVLPGPQLCLHGLSEEKLRFGGAGPIALQARHPPDAEEAAQDDGQQQQPQQRQASQPPAAQPPLQVRDPPHEVLALRVS